MTMILFTGPTLRAQDVRSVGAAECLPPVQQGDIYRAASRRRPRAIGIVDGVFQHVPSVWHKEILWAMSNGIHVFGAASMGALRAAELHSFGMVGVGRIFEAYRSGTMQPYSDAPFEDDDEVAVIHGPPETGYVALSEAMVNIRVTLAKAATAGVISGATRDALVRAAKAMFYQERSYEALLERTPAGVSSEEIGALRAWLPGGRVNLKRQDALQMLSTMRTFLDADPPPKQVSYSFEHTTLWDNAITACEGEQAALSHPEELVADELRIDSERKCTGLWRMLALQECERRGIDATVQDRRQSVAEFRRREGLTTAADLERWLADNHMDHESLSRLMGEEARLRKLATALGPASTTFGLDELRVGGDYGRLAARANHKKSSLEAIAEAASMPDEAALLQALVWYFEDRLGREIPMDIEAYARAAGYTDVTSFRRAVWRERIYCRVVEARHARSGDAE